MRFGVISGLIPATLPFADAIQRAAQTEDFSAFVAYGVAFRETIREYGLASATKMSDNGDGGHGLFQITPEDWWPLVMRQDWDALVWRDAYSNARFAMKYFLNPAEDYWSDQGLEGDALIKLIACEFNAGRARVEAAHAAGNADTATTGGDYGSFVVRVYKSLVAGEALS